MTTATKTNQFVRTSVGNINATVEVPQAVVANIRKQAIAKARKQLRAVRAEVLHFIKSDVINQDHGEHYLEDLRRMGHPFGYRNPQNIDSPWYQIHNQSGEWLVEGPDRVFKQGVSESKNYLKVWMSIDPNYYTISTTSGELPLAGLLHRGTEHMRPRPFLTLGTIEYLRAKSMLR